MLSRVNNINMFKTTVVIIALVILILFLTIAGTSINSSLKNSAFPPIQNHCPDNWVADNSGNCIIKTNVNTGIVNDFSKTNPTTFGFDSKKNVINFSDVGWKTGGISAQCNQRSWAINNQINWDTITNYNQC
jgi:hypothetical protein